MKRLNKKELALALGTSSTTLWRVIDANNKKAKKYKLKKCPKHQMYTGGRKYYFADEVKDWLDMITSYEAK